MSTTALFLILIALALGGVGGYFLRNKLLEMKVKSAEDEAQRIMKEAKRETERIKREAILEAKETIYKEKASVEEEIAQKRKELEKAEIRLIQKEEHLEKRQHQMEEKELELKRLADRLKNLEKELANQEAQLKERLEEATKRLEFVAQLTREEILVIARGHGIAHRQARYRAIQPVAAQNDIVCPVQPVYKPVQLLRHILMIRLEFDIRINALGISIAPSYTAPGYYVVPFFPANG